MPTLAEAILSHNIKKEVHANDIIIANVDFVMSHDTTTPLAIQSLHELNKNVWNKDKSIIFFDHIVPAPTIQAATLQRDIKKFAKVQQITNVFQQGISHQLMVEKHFAVPGRVIVGADSHTCTHGAVGCFATGMGSTDIAVAYATGKTWLKVPETIQLHADGKFSPGVYSKDLILSMAGKVGAEGANYKAIEYTGSTIRNMSIEERMTMTSLAVEMGAKAGMVEADDITMNYTNGIGEKIVASDQIYSESFIFDTSDVVPKIAAPHRVDNVFDVEKYSELHVDEVFVGTCTNGRISDLEIVAKILNGNKVHPDTRMVIVPASMKVQMEAYKRGYVEIFNQAGVSFMNPGCGPCIGRHQGVLAPGEVAVTTMNRNFKGRMGSSDAEIYLVSPATAAVTAIKGCVTDPREFQIQHTQESIT
jgi:3-isopropylmalate/(R)-2-methylmalate dehydratase large subunit/methanogen homoaconitase large subunit